MKQLKQITFRFYTSPIGELILGSTGEALCLADWRYRKMRAAVDKRICQFTGSQMVAGDDDILAQTEQQLTQYFGNTLTNFNLPLLLAGTAFQKKVWQQLLLIPYGHTMTYGALAEKMGNRDSVRAVAAANGANALSIVVPCHRIIGQDGELTGYAGGLKAKQYLLEKEGARFRSISPSSQTTIAFT